MQDPELGLQKEILTTEESISQAKTIKELAELLNDLHKDDYIKRGPVRPIQLRDAWIQAVKRLKEIRLGEIGLEKTSAEKANESEHPELQEAQINADLIQEFNRIRQNLETI